MIVRFLKTAETFADLHRRLGEVPLERIRMKPAPDTATEEDLAKHHGRTCELIDGVLVEKAIGDRESMLGADGFIRVARRLLRSPEATYIPWESFPGEELSADRTGPSHPGLSSKSLALRTRKPRSTGIFANCSSQGASSTG
jgi:hypothetical protein